MLFDDDFFQLTGVFGVDKKDNKEAEKEAEIQALKDAAPVNHEYSNPDADYVIESDLVTPNIKPVKDASLKPLIVVCDDDFDTLDLLKIYLSRNYRYEGFSGPKEAIFYINQNIPDLVLIDCKIHTMKPKTFMEIIRSGAGDVKFAYIGSEMELSEIDDKTLPEYVVGKIHRPVPRGELQEIIDLVIKK